MVVLEVLVVPLEVLVVLLQGLLVVAVVVSPPDHSQPCRHATVSTSTIGGGGCYLYRGEVYGRRVCETQSCKTGQGEEWVGDSIE